MASTGVFHRWTLVIGLVFFHTFFLISSAPPPQGQILPREETWRRLGVRSADIGEVDPPEFGRRILPQRRQWKSGAVNQKPLISTGSDNRRSGRPEHKTIRLIRKRLQSQLTSPPDLAVPVPVVPVPVVAAAVIPDSGKRSEVIPSINTELVVEVSTTTTSSSILDAKVTEKPAEPIQLQELEKLEEGPKEPENPEDLEKWSLTEKPEEAEESQNLEYAEESEKSVQTQQPEEPESSTQREQPEETTNAEEPEELEAISITEQPESIEIQTASETPVAIETSSGTSEVPPTTMTIPVTPATLPETSATVPVTLAIALPAISVTPTSLLVAATQINSHLSSWRIRLENFRLESIRRKNALATSTTSLATPTSTEPTKTVVTVTASRISFTESTPSVISNPDASKVIRIINLPPLQTTTTSTTTSTTTTTTTTTTAKPELPPATTTSGIPIPVMHSLEDILQRLVPALDDSNPFLVLPASGNTASTEDQPRFRKPDERLQPANGTNPADVLSGSNPASSGASITSIYVVGVVAVIPLAGIIMWLLRRRFYKRPQRLNESESSSEPDFRKKLPPVALTPSKHARLFYGSSDKEDLVSGGSGGNGGSGGSNGSAAASPWEYPRSRLRLQTLIGEGNFGQVWKAEADDICGCQGTLLVAVKSVKDGASAKEKQEILHEMAIMQQLGPHPNVVALIGCCTQQEPYLLIMEYVMYGRLLTFLRDHRTQQSYYNYSSDNEALTSRDLTTFSYCVAKGMEYIAAKGIVHRDLAARNVLVDHNKMCKVADFGLSRSVRDTAGEMYEQRVKGALPIRWMAPESLIQSVFTQKSDVWSFGILVWEIITLGSTPYPGMEAREVMKKVKEGHRLDQPNHCRRPELFRLMSRCWHSDPLRRPDFTELKHDLTRLLEDSDGYVDLDHFQESTYVSLQSPTDESEKI